jgi:hypothetical protein
LNLFLKFLILVGYMASAFHRLSISGISLIAVLGFSHSVLAVTLDDVLDSRRSIVQYQAKQESSDASIAQNEARIENLQQKINEINTELKDVKAQITKNERGMSEFPEFAANFQPKITALTSTKAKLLVQKNEHQDSISDLKDENNNLREDSESFSIRANKEESALKRLKQSYLDKQVSNELDKAEEGILVIESQEVSCSFDEIYGKHKGNKQVCLNRAIEQAKSAAAEKYAPTTITSEIESRDFQITSETSSQYYSVDVSIKKELESSIKMDAPAERFRAKFKAKILVKPAFTKKTRQKLMERFAVKLGGEVGKVAAVEKRKTIREAQARIEQEERAKAQDRKASSELDLLRQEIEALKKAQSAQQIRQQQQAQTLAKQEKESKRKAEEARIQQEIERRLRSEKKRLNKQAEEIEEEEEKDVFVPPIF